MKQIVALFLCINLLANAQETVQVISLKEAVDFALKNNAAAKNASLDVEATKYRAWEIKAMGLPKVDANFDYNYYYKRPVSPAFAKIFSDPNSLSGLINGKVITDAYVAKLTSNDPTFDKMLAASQKVTLPSMVLANNPSLGVTLSQLVFDGRYMVGLKAVKDLSFSQTLIKNKSDIDIAHDVTKAYYQAAAANSGSGDLESLMPIVDKLLHDTKATYKEGFVEQLDVDRLELIKTNLLSQILMQDRLANIALSNLKFQMGIPVSQKIVLKDKLTTLFEANQKLENENFNVQERVEYKLLDLAVKLKGYDVDQKRTGYLPTVVGFLNFGGAAQATKFADLFKKQYTTDLTGKQAGSYSSWYAQGLVGLKVNIPIFDSGDKWAKIKQARIEQSKAKNDFENFKNAAELQVQVAKVNYTSALDEELNAKKAKDLSEKIYNKNQIKFKEGVGNSFELTQSQQEFVVNKLKYVQAQLAVLTNKNELEKALGK